MPVPNKRFLELLQDIEPSHTTKSRASDAHSGVRDHLRTHGRFQIRYVSSYLSGSYARETSIRPRTTDDGQERPDIDIIIVTNFTRDDRPDDVLREVANALSNGGRGYNVERINKRSVRVETSQVEMDIVPGLRDAEWVHDRRSRDGLLALHEPTRSHELECSAEPAIRRAL